MQAPADSRLARLIRAASPAERAELRCELCSTPIPEAHRHVLETAEQRIRCACRACSLLFDRRTVGNASYRAIPEAARLVTDFALADERWAELAIPVSLAYFTRTSRDGCVSAFYPGPAGATAAVPLPAAWAALEDDNPILRELEPDVEALLVRRASAEPEHWLVPIDACFRLTGILRTRWKGLGGGSDAWNAVGAFFDELRERSRRVRAGREGRETKPANAGQQARNVR